MRKINYFFYFLLPIFSFFLLIQCKKDPDLNTVSQKNDLGHSQKDSLKKVELEKPAIKYSSFIFPKNKKDSAMAVFNEKYSGEEQDVILALNRLDTKNKWRADTLMIPDQMDSTLMAYSPFPSTLESLKDVKKMIFFSYPIQAFGIYENGKLLKWGPTSLGKKSAQTKRGLMFANWKKELAISTVDSDWKLPYNVNIHNQLGIGWHQYDLPGFPASHSCLRLLEADAKFLFSWAEQWTLTKGGGSVVTNGTPVIVFGDYNWGGKKAWRNLADNSKANDISVAEMDELIKPNLDKILEEQKKAEAVKAERNSISADNRQN